MKQIFSGEVFDVLPTSNGIVFSYKKEQIDENTVVAYKMVGFENGRITDVAKNVYLVTKFGNNYKAALNFCDNYITVKSLILSGGKMFLLKGDGTAALIDNDSTLLWSGELKYRGYNATDIALYKNALWASFADCNVLLRYNLSSMREELRIGGNKSPFDKPTSLFVEGDSVIISNSGSKKIIGVNLNSYAVTEFEEFEEPVRQYVNVQNKRFALLDSGLYLI